MMRPRRRSQLAIGLVVIAFSSSCAYFAEQLTDESFAREPEMESLRTTVIDAIDLLAPPGGDAPSLGAAGGDPDIDGSQRWVSARGRVEGELPQARDLVVASLAAANLTVIEDGPAGDTGERRQSVRATADDMVIRVNLYDVGNPAVLPSEEGTVYAEIHVALRDSVGLSWTHID